jgi:hypothetical protein
MRPYITMGFLVKLAVIAFVVGVVLGVRLGMGVESDRSGSSVAGRASAVDTYVVGGGSGTGSGAGGGR